MTELAYYRNIACIGAGYVGGPTMAVIAEQCPQYKVTVVDINPDRIARWNSDHLPIFEPGLDEVVARARGRNLFFSTDIESAIQDAHIIFVSVNTPTKTYGSGAGMAADLKYWELTARKIRDCSTSPKIIVEKSTLPVKTAQAMKRILTATETADRFEVLSNPEFLAEGSAIVDLKAPDRVLIGSDDTESGRKARDELVAIYANWVERDKILTANVWSSELSKLVANAFLAQRISSINAVSALCEKTDADVTEVARAVGMDSRLGSKFLKASVGFGGSCFKKDILNLVYLCRHYGLNEVADYWEQVVIINDYQKSRFVLNMLGNMFHTLSGKRICLMGFAFKAHTGDTRESPGILIAEKLAEEQAEIVITDPRALENARLDLRNVKGVIDFVADPYAAAAGCDALAVITEWPEYAALDFSRIYETMVKPAFIFDGRNILDHRRLFDLGFNVFPIGKPALTHF